MRTECGPHRERLSEFLDDELGEQAQAALRAHLAECAECRAELEALRRTVRAVGELPACRAPAGFAQGVVRRIRAEGAVPGPAEQPPVRIVPMLFARVLPVAAMLLVVVGLLLAVRTNGRFRGAAPDQRLAMARDPAPERISPPASVGTAPVLQSREALPAAGAIALPGLAGRREREEAVAEGRTVSDARAAEVADEIVAPFAAEAGDLAERRKGAEAKERAAAVEEAESALSWRTFGAAARIARADRDESGRLLFVQVPATETAGPGGPVQQVLTIFDDDPAALASRAVQVANESDVPASLVLGRDVRGGTVEVQLSVPLAKYGPLMKVLARLTPPEQQTLANTAAATGAFFHASLASYRSHQGLRDAAGVREDLVAERGAGEPTGAARRARALGAAAEARRPSMGKALAEGAAAPGPLEQEAAQVVGAEVEAPADGRPGAVNLLIRVRRPER
ncbi:MAG: anti-sigma factor family protein [Planctomycetota bacterium]|jgi:hypothetical protein